MNLIVHKTIRELHSKTMLQYSPKQLSRWGLVLKHTRTTERKHKIVFIQWLQ